MEKQIKTLTAHNEDLEKRMKILEKKLEEMAGGTSEKKAKKEKGLGKSKDDKAE